MLCIQQAHSMELAQYSDENGYPIQYKPIAEMPCIKLPTEWNEFSEQLYAENLTPNKIEELVEKGAVVNYLTKNSNLSCLPVPLHWAHFSTHPQAVEIMKKLIEHGAILRDFEVEPRPALFFALQPGYKESPSSEMLELLIPYENPIVTLYEYEDKNPAFIAGQYKLIKMPDNREQTDREFIINKCFSYQNINAIRLLLQLKLMSVNRGMQTFTDHKKPNKEILDLLMKNNATNIDTTLPEITEKAFRFDDQYIDFLEQICGAGAFDEKILTRMLSIKTKVDTIVKALEQNGSQQKK